MSAMRIVTRLVFLLLIAVSARVAAGAAILPDDAPPPSVAGSAADAEIRRVFTIPLSGAESAGASLPAAARLDVTLIASPARARSGDRILLSIEIDAPRDVRLTLADPTSKTFRVTRHGDVFDVPAGERRRYRQSWSLDTFAAGRHELPEIRITVDGPSTPAQTHRAPGLPVDVTPVRADDDQAIRALRGWAEADDAAPGPTARSRWLMAVAAGLLALAALAAAVLFVVRRRREPAPVPLPPPDVEALAAIDALLARGLLEAGEIERLHRELGLILRRFLERRFDVHSLDRTTPEILRATARHPALTDAQRERLRAFLAQVDLVSFARFEPGRRDSESSIASLRAFIEASRMPAGPRERAP